MVDFSFLVKNPRTVSFSDSCFSQELCDQLYAMILVDDEIHLDVTLPDKLEFKYTQKQLIDSFLVCRQLWREGLMEPGFTDILHSLCISCSLSDKERALYKKVRAKFKHLCYAYRAFDERHQRPYWLGKMTGLLGKLQDGFKHDKTLIVKPRAFLLAYIWNEEGLSFLKKETDFFFPSNLASFVSFLQKKVGEIGRELNNGTIVTPYQFHGLRKNVSMLAATYGTLDVLFPSDYHHQFFQYLATINGLMGGYHDQLVEKRLNKSQNYYFDRFSILEPILSRLRVLVDRFGHVGAV